MTRRAAIIAFSLVVAIGLLGLQSWDVALGRVQRSAIKAIEERTGFVVKAIERAEFALLPLPRISLSQVAFTQRDGALAGEAVRVKAHLRLLPLLGGRISFDRVDLIAPRIDVAVPAGSDGVTEWLASPLAELERLQSQSKIVIRSGSLFLRASGAIQSVVRDLDLVIDERGLNEPLNLSGSLNWRGVPTEVSLLWPMVGGNAKAALSATSSLLKLRFEGSRSGPGEPVISGPLVLSTPSLPKLLGWFGEESRLGSALGAVAVSADIQVKAREVSFNSAIVNLDGERLDGAIKLAETGGRFALSGTLAGAVEAPHAFADLQLDADLSREAVLKKLDELERIARRNGTAIGMASAFDESVDAIREWCEEASGRGIEIVGVASLAAVPAKQ